MNEIYCSIWIEKRKGSLSVYSLRDSRMRAHERDRFAVHYGVSMVYAVNDHHGLRDHYRESIREGHTEQDSIDFKIYLDQVGVRVY